MMRGWSFPLGRWMGVDLRLHTFFAMLLACCLLLADGHMGRGIGLWLLLVLAVLCREIPRVLAAVWLGLRLRSILLLPIGGLFAYGDPESQERGARTRTVLVLMAAGVGGNLLSAAVLTGLLLGASPQIDLLGRPLVTPLHLLRSAVWLNLGMAVLHLLPAYPLDAGRLFRGNAARDKGGVQATRASAGLTQMIALTLIVAGIYLPNAWLVVAGFFILIGSQVEDQGVMFQSVVDTVQMKDVMLTDFATLAPSDTLEDALSHCIHSLQDDFPVVRGDALVGMISRQKILEALRFDGNGYVQSVMSKTFPVVKPEDSLGLMIRRMTAGRGLGMVPVAEGERVVGIVSLQNLMHSMGPLADYRRAVNRARE